MLFVQIIVGGITRLTGSGLSITKWEIVTGTFPPSSSLEWEAAFNDYKATPQYEKINKGMNLSEFKFIFFWEYIHRLWARLMGFVFLIPCIFFLLFKWVDPPLLKRLGIVILLAVLAASFGWIMVASGLIERPWVNAYKLALHLCIGISVYAAMLWTCFYAFKVDRYQVGSKFKRSTNILFYLLLVQLFIGGIMSGMKAGLFFPTWPEMDGGFIPQVLFNKSEWNVDNFNYYENSLLLPALVQFVHRIIAYVLTISGLYYIYRYFNDLDLIRFRPGIALFITLLIIQVLLGVLTLINCIGTIPVGLGVSHQAVAILLLSSLLFIKYRIDYRA